METVLHSKAESTFVGTDTSLMRRVGELSAFEWLELWECSQGLTSAQRALAWLRRASLEPEDDPAFWSIIERDSQILFLRESTFGLELEGVAECPGCGEQLELGFTTRDILSCIAVPCTRIEIEIEINDYIAHFRLPMAGDLARLSASTSEAARNELLSACFLRGQCSDKPLSFDEIPETMKTAVEEEMARRDPYANIEFTLNCPTCSQAWEQPFDAASFLWREMEAWAHRTLNEIHTLASVYGWTESEILQLSPTRRQLYLSLIGT
jgi:uncharacterized protein (UPF0212 family)